MSMQLSSEPSGFSATEVGPCGLSIRRQFSWGSEPVEHIRALQTDGSRSWVVCDTSLSVGAAVFLWDALGIYDTRPVLAFHPKLTPYKVAVAWTLPILRPLATLLDVQLRKGRVAAYANPWLASRASLQAQIMQFDEMGIYFSVILDESTQRTGLAHVRHRDTTLKEQVHVTQVWKRLSESLPRA